MPAPAPAPKPPPATLEAAWTAVLAELPEAEAVAIHAVAFPIGVVEGTFRVGVRRELWRARVRDGIGTVDLAALVPGARRVEVVVEGEQGATGREVIAEAELRRRIAARASAEGSEAVRRLVETFGGELEEVLPSALDLPADGSGAEEEGGEAALPLSS